jgi:hypothetical protein
MILKQRKQKVQKDRPKSLLAIRTQNQEGTQAVTDSTGRAARCCGQRIYVMCNCTFQHGFMGNFDKELPKVDAMLSSTEYLRQAAEASRCSRACLVLFRCCRKRRCELIEVVAE